MEKQMFDAQSPSAVDRVTTDGIEQPPVEEKQPDKLTPSIEPTDLENLPSISALEEDILTALMGQPLYGLQICQAIEDSSEGKQILKIGSLYPSLHRLESKGLLTSWMSEQGAKSRRGNRRKYYRMTIRGAGALTQKRQMRDRLSKWSQDLVPV